MLACLINSILYSYFEVTAFFLFYNINIFEIQIFYQTIGISYILFFGGLIKIFFTKRNLLLLLLGIETMMLGIIFFLLSSFNEMCLFNSFNYSIVFTVLTLIISESVVGLSLVLLLSKSFNSIDLLKLNKLKG